MILLRSFILQQRYPQNIQMYPISYQIVEIMSSVALVHMLNLCSVYRDYVCLPSFVLVVDSKTKGHEEQLLVMPAGFHRWCWVPSMRSLLWQFLNL